MPGAAHVYYHVILLQSLMRS